jgi:hypothetical protein
MLTGAAGNYSKATIQSTIENYGYRNQIFVNSLDCITETSCVAVGTITKNRSNYSFSSVFDPTRWDQAILNTFSEKIDFAGEGNPPLSTLRSVSCVSQTFCVAVGSDADVKPQFAVGNPAKWKLKTLPKFKYMSSLRYVTCVSTTYCVAVGQANEIFVEQTKLIVFAGDPNTWDDTKATVVQFPDLYEPSGVSCVAAKDCVLTLYAMNNSSQGNVYKGDPAKLTVASVKHFGTNGYLNKLSCFTKTNCVAIGLGTSGRPPKKGQPVGNYSTSLRLQTGNPAQWNLSNVTDVNAISSGSAATAELGLRGTAVFSSDNWIHNRYYGYLDMDCRTSNECYAIGLLDVSGSTYISAFDPASSAVVSAVEQSLPSKFKNANLEVVSCTPTQCYAMGNSDKGPFIVNISGQAPIN